MKSVKGYSKEYYKNRSPVAKEFETIENAAEYLASKYGSTVKKMKDSILNDTNCDAVYFEDGTVILCEFT